MSDAAPLSPKYFMTVYGSQRAFNPPKYSHTYASFKHRLFHPDGSVVDSEFAISWLPHDGVINPLGPPEKGRNYSLAETVAWLDGKGSDIRWTSGETEINADLFHSASARFSELNAGSLKYVMIDSIFSRPHQASNCIHALSDIEVARERLGMAFTGILRGIQASLFVYRYLSPFYVLPMRMAAEDETLLAMIQRDEVRLAGTLAGVHDVLSGLMDLAAASYHYGEKRPVD